MNIFFIILGACIVIVSPILGFIVFDRKLKKIKQTWRTEYRDSIEKVTKYKEEEQKEISNLKTLRIAIGIAIFGLLITIFGLSFEIIPTGYTGVRIRFGQVNEQVVNNGFNFKTPLVESIKKVNNKLQDYKVNEKIWSETSLRTALFYENIVVSYQIYSENSAWIYSNVTDYTKNLITPDIVASAIKQSSVVLLDNEATNRGIIEPLIAINLQRALDEKYGKSILRIARVVVTNVDFEESYVIAIAEKQRAQLAYEQQQIENKRAIEKAEADAKVKLTQVEADATAKLMSAEAEAKANKTIASSLTDDIFTQRFYEKWDGKLPSVIGSNETIIDISKIISQ